MEYKPHDYQRTAYNWIMEHERCGLFLDMGLGKTVVTLTAIRDLILSLEVERVLVIAPLRVANDTWTREADKWDHLQDLKISKVTGTEKQRREALSINADVYVTNRENVTWLIEKELWRPDFDMVVIDELSSFKSPSAKRFKQLRKRISGVSRVVGLTGTPAPNGYLDLWSEIYLLDRGERLGRTVTGYRQGFFDNYSRDPAYGIYKLRRGAKEQIDKRLEDICMSMKAVDYLKMPEKIENVIPITLTSKERAAYDAMEKAQLLHIGDTEVAAFSAAAALNKLLQISNGFVYDEEGVPHRIHEKKLDALEEIIDTNPGQPILVFYNFSADKEALLQRFPEARILDTSEDISDWNAGKIPLILAHPASVGHGLNVQSGGHIIVWYGPIWSLELYQQANARLYRQGQKSDHVVINILSTSGTADEDVIKALQNKDITQESLMRALRARR